MNSALGGYMCGTQGAAVVLKSITNHVKAFIRASSQPCGREYAQQEHARTHRQPRCESTHRRSSASRALPRMDSISSE
jgi:hypothetical protein